MQVTIALAQSGYPTDGDVLAQVESCVAQAQTAGAALVAFPEDLMCPRHLRSAELRALAEPLDGPFAHGLCDIAARHGLWLVATMFERNPAGPPFNTALVIDDTGSVRGSYRKCHLYDAHGVLESRRTTAGDALFQPLDAPFGRLGLGICYDLRFPELARAAALAGCDLLLYPACWHDGPHKREHWQTLLRARAIENELFVAGICHAGERFVENSLVADPLGRIVTPEAYGETLLFATIETQDAATAREAMPLLAHRRPELYRERG